MGSYIDSDRSLDTKLMVLHYISDCFMCGSMLADGGLGRGLRMPGKIEQILKQNVGERRETVDSTRKRCHSRTCSNRPAVNFNLCHADRGLCTLLGLGYICWDVQSREYW